MVLKAFRFETTPESIAFASAGVDDVQLVVALRDTHNLVCIKLSDMSQYLFSMNENVWDTHVSFNALFISVHPDRRTFVVCTDKDKHILFRLEENCKRLRIFCEHTCGQYGKPKVFCTFVILSFIFMNFVRLLGTLLGNISFLIAIPTLI